MKRSRFTDERIIGVLRERETGGTTVDLSRRHGTLHPEGQILGHGVPDAERLKSLARLRAVGPPNHDAGVATTAGSPALLADRASQRPADVGIKP